MAGDPGSVLLVTAHPDDEAMFFAPSLAHFAARGLTLARWRLCGGVPATALAWAPGLASGGAVGETLLLGCADGSLRLTTAGGRVACHTVA